jgi:L-fuculose-phosphate aldolase
MSTATSNDASEIAKELIRAGRRMLDDGLVLGTSGNVSARTPEGMLITPGTMAYRDITADDLCLVDRNGVQLAGRGQPSSETPMHLAVYRATDAAAIVHTHSPAAVSVSTVVEALPAIHYGIAQFGGHDVRVAGYERFGSDALADAAAAAIDGRTGVLLRNHGTLTCGGSVEEAYQRAVLLEWLARVYRDARLMGDPTILDEADLALVIAESRRRRYGAVIA